MKTKLWLAAAEPASQTMAVHRPALASQAPHTSKHFHNNIFGNCKHLQENTHDHRND